MSTSQLPVPTDPFEAERRRSRWNFAIVFCGALFAVAAGWGWHEYSARSGWRGRVVAGGHRLALGEADTGNRDAFEQIDSPEVWFRVVLHGVPIGSEIDLGCRWFDPAGTVAHENSWTTKRISHDGWETHCRHRILRDAPPAAGTWKVEMFLDDGRVVDTASFTVRSAATP